MMLKLMKRLMALIVLILAGCLTGFFYLIQLPHAFSPSRLIVEIQFGKSLRLLSREFTQLGLIENPQLFEGLVRLSANAAHVKSGNYEIHSPISAFQLMQKITGHDSDQSTVRLVEGWNFQQVRQVLNDNEALTHESRDLSDQDIAKALGISGSVLEGLIYPESYFSPRGTSDLRVLARGYSRMQQVLENEWSSKSDDLPLESPYEALILASLVEKETGRAEDRDMVSSVFVNRLRKNMRLQTDPSVIYGMKNTYTGHLKHHDLLVDTPWNTYTRSGLPPTPIALAGLAALKAALHPRVSDKLYFVARGDGSSQFSTTLEEHNLAVKRYQRSGKP